MTTVQGRPLTEARCSLCGWSEVSPRPAPDECPQCHGICPTCFAGGVDVMQEDVRALLILLGLGDHARPISCHEVIQREILPAIRDLQAKAAIRATTLPRDPEMFKVAPVSDPSETLALKADGFATEFEAMSDPDYPWSGNRSECAECAMTAALARQAAEREETLALMEKHKLIVMPSSGDGSWYAGTDDAGEWGPTIGDAVRECVKRIREGK